MSERSRSCRSATASTSDSQILETWLELMRSTPKAGATCSTLLVDTPHVTISETAAPTALSTLE